MNKTAQAIILGIMCLLLTIGICLQVKTVNSNGTTTSSNQELNSLKAQVLKMKEKYEESYSRLEKTQDELETVRTNVSSSDNELKSLEEEIKKYNVLLGTTDAKGQGVTITIADSNASNNALAFLEDPVIHNTDILEVVNELKNAGAEAIEVNGQRIVNTTAISCDGNVTTVNGEKISSPFVINAIGFPARLATLYRPNSYIRYQLEEKSGIRTSYKELEKIKIPKYIGTTSFKYAKAVK